MQNNTKHIIIGYLENLMLEDGPNVAKIVVEKIFYMEVES